MKGLIFLCCALLCCFVLTLSPVDAGPCSGGSCTIEVQASAIVADPVGRPVIAAAGRSVGIVGKAATAPVRIVAKIAEKKPVRSAVKAVASAKPVRRTVAGAVRLICPGRRASE